MTPPSRLSPLIPKDLQKILDATTLRQLYEEVDSKTPLSEFDVVLAGLPATGKTTVADILAEVFGIKATQLTVLYDPDSETFCDKDLAQLVRAKKPIVVWLECSQEEITKRWQRDSRKNREKLFPRFITTLKKLPGFLKGVRVKHVVDCNSKMPCEIVKAVLEIFGAVTGSAHQASVTPAALPLPTTNSLYGNAHSAPKLKLCDDTNRPV